MSTELEFSTKSAAELCPDAYAALFQSDGLGAIRDRKLDGEQCAYVLGQYQNYVEAFPRLVALGISKLESDEARIPLVANLWEEHGEGDVRKAHRSVYKELLCRIASVSPSVAGLLSLDYNAAATNFVSMCESTLSNAAAPAAMGFLGPGTEGTTPDLFSVVPRLLKPFGLEGEDTFFRPHQELDIEHIKLFIPAIQTVLHPTDKWHTDQFIMGIRSALQFERLFWDGVVEESQKVQL